MDSTLYSTLNAVLREILEAMNSPLVSKSNYGLLKRLREKTKNTKGVICLGHFERLGKAETIPKLLGLGICLLIIAERKESITRIEPTARFQIINLV